MAFVNRNICKSFKLSTSVSLQKLSDQECSEVIILSRGTVEIYDHQNPTVGFQLLSGEDFTFRGLNNSNQLSAKGSGDIYYRTQFYSGIPDL